MIDFGWHRMGEEEREKREVYRYLGAHTNISQELLNVYVSS